MTQTFIFKVSLDCDACKKKVKKALNGIQGVETIDVDMRNEKVTVVGSVDPQRLVKCLEKIGKRVDLPGGKWHYMDDENSDNLTFDSGFNFGKGGNRNKNVLRGKTVSADMNEDEAAPASEVYAHIFSDENANSCVIM